MITDEDSTVESEPYPYQRSVDDFVNSYQCIGNENITSVGNYLKIGRQPLRIDLY